MTELDLFRMAFPEDFILETVLPTTNKYIDGDDIDLREFYVWLGCYFLWPVLRECRTVENGGLRNQ